MSSSEENRERWMPNERTVYFHRLNRHGSKQVNHETHEKHEKGEDMEIVYKEESYRIMGACFEVYKRIVI